MYIFDRVNIVLYLFIYFRNTYNERPQFIFILMHQCNLKNVQLFDQLAFDNNPIRRKSWSELTLSVRHISPSLLVWGYLIHLDNHRNIWLANWEYFAGCPTSFDRRVWTNLERSERTLGRTLGTLICCSFVCHSPIDPTTSTLVQTERDEKYDKIRRVELVSKNVQQNL